MSAAIEVMAVGRESGPALVGAVWFCSGVFESRIKRMEMH